MTDNLTDQLARNPHAMKATWRIRGPLEDLTLSQLEDLLTDRVHDDLTRLNRMIDRGPAWSIHHGDPATITAVFTTRTVPEMPHSTRRTAA